MNVVRWIESGHIHLTLGLIKQSNTHTHAPLPTRAPSHNHSYSAEGYRSLLGRMILSCPNYLNADVMSDGEDLCRHQQEPPARAPMNHEKILRAGPSEMPLRSWYNFGTKHFRLTDFCQPEMKKRTMLRHKTSTAWSCAEDSDEILENKISMNDK